MECPNGTVNWKQIYGEDAFILRPPIYESQLREKRRMRTVDEAGLRERAEAYAKVGGCRLGPGARQGQHHHSAAPLSSTCSVDCALGHTQ